MALVPVSISEGAVNAPQGAGTLPAAAGIGIDTTPHAFDLTSYQGRLVRLTVTGTARYRFAETASDTFTTTEELAPDPTVAAFCLSERTLAVPRQSTGGGRVYLLVAAASGSIDASVEGA